MYVRWKKRRMTRSEWVHVADDWPRDPDDMGYHAKQPGRPQGCYALTATLVESKRVNGKPRQRHVAYLGTITVWDDLPWYGESWRTLPIGTGGVACESHTVSFWDDVRKRLDALNGRVGRKRIMASIAATVPRPNAKTRRRTERERKAWLEGLKVLLQMRRR